MARSKALIDFIKQETEEVPVQESFLSNLKRSIELDKQKEGYVPSERYTPSGLNCVRESYYKLTGHTPDKSDDNYCLIGICNSGTDIHEHTQNAISNMINNGFDVEYIDVAKYVEQRNLPLEIVKKQGNETKLYNRDLNMVFLCDGIVRIGNHYYILELKTEGSYKFMQRKAINPDHRHQIFSYSLNLGISDVIMIYISRDNLDMKSYLYTVTDEEREEVLDFIHTCDHYIGKKMAPPKPEVPNKKACTYCNYKSYCKRGDN